MSSTKEVENKIVLALYPMNLLLDEYKKYYLFFQILIA